MTIVNRKSQDFRLKRLTKVLKRRNCWSVISHQHGARIISRTINTASATVLVSIHLYLFDAILTGRKTFINVEPNLKYKVTNLYQHDKIPQVILTLLNKP